MTEERTVKKGHQTPRWWLWRDSHSVTASSTGELAQVVGTERVRSREPRLRGQGKGGKPA